MLRVPCCAGAHMLPKLRGCYGLYNTFDVQIPWVGPGSEVACATDQPARLPCMRFRGDKRTRNQNVVGDDIHTAANDAAGRYARAGRMPARHRLPVCQSGHETGGCGF